MTTYPVPEAAVLPPIITKSLATYDKWLRLTGDPATVVTPDVGEAAPAAAAAITFEDRLRAIPTAKEYFRPNGWKYLPRMMAIAPKLTIQDVAFLRAAYQQRMPILLYGDPGTGKTALVEAALDGVITIQGTVETEVADFVGAFVQNPDGTYDWVDGPLVVAMITGKPLLIDEIALIDPRVMAVAYGIMDGRGELVVTQNPKRGVVKAEDGFCVYGACNPNVPGALMSDALLSRFPLHLEMTTDWALAKQLGVGAQIIQVARNIHLKARTGEIMAPPQLREVLTFEQVKENFGEMIALQNFVGQARPEDRAAIQSQIESVFGNSTKALSL